MTPIERKETCHQKLYKADILDALVVRSAKDFIRETDKEELIKSYEDKTKQQLKASTVRLNKTEAELAKKEREIAKLKDEVMKALLGESTFSQDLLNEMLKTKESEFATIIQITEAAQHEILQLDQILNMQYAVAEEMKGWAERFDGQPIETKKAMLINIIDRIIVNGENIEIIYKQKLNPLSNLKAVNLYNIQENQLNVEDTTQMPANSCVKGYEQAIQSTLCQQLGSSEKKELRYSLKKRT